MSRQKNPPSQPAPHSWSVDAWPGSVYPNDAGKARYLIRSNRDALLAAGALSRVGRALVVIGGPYSRWLDAQAGRVKGYEVSANRGGSEHHAVATG